MVISLRVPDEQAQRYKNFAAERGMTVSDFVRECVEKCIGEAEEILRQAEERRAREERIADLKRRAEQVYGILADTPLAQMTDEEIKAEIHSRYA